MIYLPSLRNNNQQHQHNNQHHNHRQTPILPRLARNPIQPPPRAPKLRRVPIHPFLHIIQQHDLAVQLIPNLHAEFALAADTRAELVELVVLLADHAAVVGVDLLVVEGGVVRGLLIGGGGVVAVGEEGCAIGGFDGVWGRGGVWGVVGEAHGFRGGGALFGGLLGGGEVRGEGGVVGGLQGG